MPIQKTKIEVTVLMEADTPEDANATLANMDLNRIARQMDEGDFVGSVHVGDTTTIDAGDVEAELRAIGSDASFFGIDALDGDDVDDAGDDAR